MTNQSPYPTQSTGARLHAAATNLAGLKAPALSYAVAMPDGTLSSGALGVADLSTGRRATTHDQYPWFSMTKIATATAVMRLHTEGQLDLDSPVAEFLPAYDPGRRGHPTVRQLLTHTAGLPNPLPIRWVRPAHRPPSATLLKTLLDKHGKPRRAPGGRAAYSNIGYLLAGRVIEAVTGRSVEQAITELVLLPLGMDRTRFSFDPERPLATGYVSAPRAAHPVVKAMLPTGIAGPSAGRSLGLRPFLVEGAAYGGLIGPPTDAVKLAAAHLPGFDDGRPSGALGDLSHMRVIQHRGRPFDHGIGWFRKPADEGRSPAFVEHYGTGGGFWNAMRIYPELGVAIVAMTNATSAWPFDAFCTDVIHALDLHTSLTPHP